MKIKSVNDASGNLWAYRFACPGCKVGHHVGLGWTFNGSFDAPTFSPSVLVTGGGDANYRCHSFVREGRIEFLADCSHAMAGHTVELPEVE